MNRIQKMSWLMVITMGAALVCSAIAVTILILCGKGGDQA